MDVKGKWKKTGLILSQKNNSHNQGKNALITNNCRHLHDNLNVVYVLK